MSKSQAIAFFEEISKNQQLAREVEKVVEGKKSDEAKAKELISLAKKHNFIFTPEDAQNAQEALKKPLSTEEMLEVSGGKLNLKSSVMAAAMLFGLGVGGAAMSSMDASAMKRTTLGYGKSGKIDPPNSDRQQTTPQMQPAANRTQGQTLPADQQEDSFFDAIMRYVQGQPTTNGSQQQTTLQTQPDTTGTTNSTQRQTPHATPLRESLLDAVMRHAQNLQRPMPQQTQPATTGATNSAQRRTPPGNSQGLRPETHQPRLDQAERREDATYERLIRGGNDREIKIALLKEDRGRLAGEYKEDGSWIEMVACAVANGFSPDFNKKLDKTFVRAPREGVGSPCAYCGETGCVKIGEPYSHCSSRIFPVRCTNVGCPLNWVILNRFRKVPARDQDITPTDRDVTRWNLLPQLIAEIENLVARTEYDDYGNAVRLHDSAEAVQQEKARKQEERRQEEVRRQEARRQKELRRQEARRQLFEKALGNEPLSLEEKKALARAVAKSGRIHCPNTNIDTNGTCNSTNIGINGSPSKTICYFYCNDCVKRNKATMGKVRTTFAVSYEKMRETIKTAVQLDFRPPLEEVENVELSEQQMQVNPEIIDVGATDFNTNQTNDNNNNNNNINNLNNLNNNSLNRYVECEFYDSQGNLIELDEEGRPTVKERGNGPQQSMQNMNQMNIPDQNQQPVNVQMQNMQQMNNRPQNAQVDQNQQIMTYQPGLNFDPTQELQPPSAQQNGTQPQQNLIQQPILNLDLHHGPVGNYVNALNTDTQELAQYTGMLLELISTGQAANVAQIGEVEIAAKTVVNRVFERELQDQANQIILNTLGADNRYLGAAQAFTDQLKRFNNVLDMIGKQWK